MGYDIESYAGTILGIDCKTRVTRETAPNLLEPACGFQKSRIRIRYERSSKEGYETVNFDLPESYIGREVQINNSTWRNETGIVVERQEIVSLNGLERIAIQVLFT